MWKRGSDVCASHYDGCTEREDEVSGVSVGRGVGDVSGWWGDVFVSVNPC